MILWMGTIALSVVILVLSAAARGNEPHLAYFHMGVSALVAITFAMIAVREGRQMIAERASDVELSAAMARFMGLVWSWGALALVITYATGIVTWVEWPGFFVAFLVAAGLSFFVSFRLRSEDRKGSTDGMMRISRYLAWFQLVGMVIVMAGLLIDGKMARFLEVQSPGWQDWAANNYFFFGALALSAISLYAIRVTKTDAVSDAPA